MKSLEELANWAKLPFGSIAERIRAYADPQYGSDSAYVDAVIAKERLTPDGPGSGSCTFVRNTARSVVVKGDPDGPTLQEEEHRGPDARFTEATNGGVQLRITDKRQEQEDKLFGRTSE